MQDVMRAICCCFVHKDKDETSNVSRSRSVDAGSRGSTKPTPSTPPSARIPDPILPSQLSREIWDAAYESLEGAEESAELVERYLGYLARVLAPDNLSAPADLHDRNKRQEYMQRLVKEGQSKVSRASKICQRIGTFADAILAIKPIGDAAVTGIPQAAPAALPWAGVCLGLQMLSNPAKAARSNLEGMTCVISKMEWYCSFTDHLLDQQGNKSLDQEMEQLRQKVIMLYKAILSYQMKSICSYFDHQGRAFLHAAMNSNEWDDALSKVTTAEDDLLHRWHNVNDITAQKLSHQRVELSKSMTEQLGDIRQSLWDFTTQQRQFKRDQKKDRMLADLRFTNPQDDLQRIINEKNETLMDDTWNWILDDPRLTEIADWGEYNPSTPRMLWIKGTGGTGKTMLLIALIRYFSQQSAVFSPSLSFSFFQSNTRLDNMAAIMKSLMWMLLIQQPDLMSHLEQDYQDSGGQNPFSDVNSSVALARVFGSMIKDAKPVLFLIDALDECDQGLTELIRVIANSVTNSNKVRWIVSSRSDVKVDEHLNQFDAQQRPSQQTAASLVQIDIQHKEDRLNRYIHHKLDELKTSPFGNEYTETMFTEIEEQVRKQSDNNFLWVSIVFSDLKDTRPEFASKSIPDFPPGLSKLYDHKLEKLMTKHENDPERQQQCKDILKVISLIYHLPLSLAELDMLLPWSKKTDCYKSVQDCNSFVTVTEKMIYANHKSAMDFLKNQPSALASCTIRGHRDIFNHSINKMPTVLERDIYKLGDWGIKSSEVVQPANDPLLEIKYGCLFWLDHLHDAVVQESDPDEVTEMCQSALRFLESHFLHWIESLSLLKQLPRAIPSINRLKMGKIANTVLRDFLNEADRFIAKFQFIIEQAPLQLYGGALVFCPTQSIIKKLFWGQRMPCIQDVLGPYNRTGIQTNWDAYRQALPRCSWQPKNVSFAPDGRMFASTAEKSIRLWTINPLTATATFSQSLSLPFSEVTCLSFSPDSKLLASGLISGNILLWSIDSAMGAGALVQTIAANTEWVWSVAFSHDSSILASVSREKIHLWAITSTSATCTCVLIRSWMSFRSIAFSPNSRFLVAGTDDRSVCLWGVDLKRGTGIFIKTFETMGRLVRDLAFSRNGGFLAAAADSLILWKINPSTAAVISETVLGRAYSVAFSPDDKLLACGSENGNIIIISNFRSGAMNAKNQRTFQGPGYPVSSLSFSPDGKMLASAFLLGPTLLWALEDANSPNLTGTLETPELDSNAKPPIDALAFSSNGTKLVTCHRGNSVRIWTVDTRISLWKEFQLDGEHAQPNLEFFVKVAFSSTAKMLSLSTVNGQLFVWDIDSLPESSRNPQPFHMLKRDLRFTELAFSPDGKILATATKQGPVLLWDIDLEMKTLNFNRTVFSYTMQIYHLAISPDCRFLACQAWDNWIEVWKLDEADGIPTRYQTHESFDMDAKLEFSADGRSIKAGSEVISLNSETDPLLAEGWSDLEHDNDGWVSRGGRNFLWCPEDFLVRYAASHQNGLALVQYRGQITYISFDFA
ncbi:hypothetical protein ASPZODRAFT_166592 [Penicilliopsis zonata CBS 506.65]|uniref:NACHT domain-containing protein n=1 Tax=Penicilliopsis zonata CBS 506.65 TaxID=1073090 RepID=A0A1L9SJQ5_9EURO|nr:hypothetical protein ASPZODRAFT_166592 [Penicilliopsis zonata CBS 506.65]OJJ47397.1 hypothetical protein ASPZODRAFT_166592 [Penicilliopsis zonata CBS 506.65]